MSNQVVFQTWSWYHNNSDSCEILSGHYTKNIHRVTPELYWFLYAVFCHKINHFLSQYHVYYKTVTKYGTLTVRSFQRCVFCQDYKKYQIF